MSIFAKPKLRQDLSILNKQTQPTPHQFKLWIWNYNTDMVPPERETGFSYAHITGLALGWEHSYSQILSGSIAGAHFYGAPQFYEYGSSMTLQNPLECELCSGNEGDDIFARNESFPLGQMKDVKYLSSAEAKAQIAQSKSHLDPRQVTFVEATTELPAWKIKKAFGGKIPPSARAEPKTKAWQKYWDQFDHSFVPWDEETQAPLGRWTLAKRARRPRDESIYDLKIGSCRLVAGQVDGKNLPLALEEAELKIPIDRNQYKWIWELGRGSTITRYAFQEALRAAVYIAYQQLISSGGKLEEAYFFAHALDLDRANYFHQQYGMSFFSEYAQGGRPGERVLVIPMRDLFAQFNPDEFGAQIASLAKTQAVKPGSLLPFFQQGKNLIQPFLEVKASIPHDERLILELRDFSSLWKIMAQRSRQYTNLTLPEQSVVNEFYAQLQPQITERDILGAQLEKISRSNSVERLAPLHGARDFNRGPGMSTMVEVHQYLAKSPTIEIFPHFKLNKNNLNLEDVLLIVYSHYLQELHALGIADPAKFLRENRIHFALTLEDQPFARNFENHFFIERSPVQVQHGMTSFFGGFIDNIARKCLDSQIFSIDFLESLRHRHLISLPEAQLERSNAMGYLLQKQIDFINP